VATSFLLRSSRLLLYHLAGTLLTEASFLAAKRRDGSFPLRPKIIATKGRLGLKLKRRTVAGGAAKPSISTQEWQRGDGLEVELGQVNSALAESFWEGMPASEDSEVSPAFALQVPVTFPLTLWMVYER
jgi:hypothetical protein